jgi:hypothetical protein
MHCLLMWIAQESSRGLCPMCRQRFEWRREENLAAVNAGMPGHGAIAGQGADSAETGAEETEEAEEGGDDGGGSEGG